MGWEMSPQGSGVEQQPPIPCNHADVKFFDGDLENPIAGPTAQGVSHEKCGYVWTGSLYLNGICAYALAQETEAVRDPYAHSFVKCLSILHPRRILSAWPKHLQLEPVFDSQMNILDFQAWAHKTKASVVGLSGIDNMDKHHFGQLVEMLRSGRGVSLPSR